MDFNDFPEPLRSEAIQLRTDYEEGELTKKGYVKRFEFLVSKLKKLEFNKDVLEEIGEPSINLTRNSNSPKSLQFDSPNNIDTSFNINERSQDSFLLAEDEPRPFSNNNYISSRESLTSPAMSQDFRSVENSSTTNFDKSFVKHVGHKITQKQVSEPISKSGKYNNTNNDSVTSLSSETAQKNDKNGSLRRINSSNKHRSMLTDKFETLVTKGSHLGKKAKSKFKSISSNHFNNNSDGFSVGRYSQNITSRDYETSRTVLGSPQIDKNLESIVESNTDINDICYDMFEIIQRRALYTPKHTAYKVVDANGTEKQSVGWKSLFAMIQERTLLLERKITNKKLKPDDKIGLYYTKNEIIELMVSFTACRKCSLIPFSIVEVDSCSDLAFIINNSKCKYIITTPNNYNTIVEETEKEHKNLYYDTLRKVKWIYPSVASTYINKFKTTKKTSITNNDNNFPQDATFSSFSSTNRESFYVEYCKFKNKELKGVIMTSSKIKAYLDSLSSVFESTHLDKSLNVMTNAQVVPHNKDSSILLNFLEPRKGLGFMFGYFISTFYGFKTVFVSQKTIEKTNLIPKIFEKYMANMYLLDYSFVDALNRNKSSDIVINKTPANIYTKTPRLVLVDCENIDVDMDKKLNETLCEFFKEPQKTIISHMFSLPLSAGCVFGMSNKFITIKDIEQEPTYVLRERLQNLQIEIIDKNDLDNYNIDIDIVPVKTYNIIASDNDTIVIANSDTKLICKPNEIGHIFIKSSSYIGSAFLNMPDSTNETFCNELIYPNKEETCAPYTHSGIYGCFIKESKLLVLSETHKIIHNNNREIIFEFDILRSIKMCSKNIYSSTVFEIDINQDLSCCVVLIETHLNQNSRLIIKDQIFKQLRNIHKIDIFALGVCEINTLPRATNNYNSNKIDSLTSKSRFLNKDINLKEWFINELSLPSSIIKKQENTLPKVFKEVNMKKLAKRTVSGVENPSSETVNQNVLSITRLIQLNGISENSKQIAFTTLDAKGRHFKVLKMDKLLSMINTISYCIINSLNIKLKETVLVLLTNPLDFVSAVHGCLACGVTVIPGWEPNFNSEQEMEMFVEILTLSNCKLIIADNHYEEILQRMNLKSFFPKSKDPHITNFKNMISSNKREVKNWVQNNTDSDLSSELVLVSITGNDYQCVSFDSQTILNILQTMKNTLSINASTNKRPLLNGMRMYNEYGFFYSCMLGLYTQNMTILFSPEDFYVAPQNWFKTIEEQKIKTTFITMKMVKHLYQTISSVTQQKKKFDFSFLESLVVVINNREDTKSVKAIMSLISKTPLDQKIIPVLSCSFNPMVTFEYLGLGKEYCFDISKIKNFEAVSVPNSNSKNMHIFSVGKLAHSIKAAIINPITNKICKPGLIGELLISSNETNATILYDSKINNKIWDSQVEINKKLRLSNPVKNMYFYKTGLFAFFYKHNENDKELDLFVMGNKDDAIIIDTDHNILHFVNELEQTTIAQINKNTKLEISISCINNNRIIVFVEDVSDSEKEPNKTSNSGQQNHSSHSTTTKRKYIDCAALITTLILKEHYILITKIVFVKKGTIKTSRNGTKMRRKLLNDYIEDTNFKLYSILFEYDV